MSKQTISLAKKDYVDSIRVPYKLEIVANSGTYANAFFGTGTGESITNYQLVFSTTVFLPYSYGTKSGTSVNGLVGIFTDAGLSYRNQPNVTPVAAGTSDVLASPCVITRINTTTGTIIKLGEGLTINSGIKSTTGLTDYTGGTVPVSRAMVIIDGIVYLADALNGTTSTDTYTTQTGSGSVSSTKVSKVVVTPGNNDLNIITAENNIGSSGSVMASRMIPMRFIITDTGAICPNQLISFSLFKM